YFLLPRLFTPARLLTALPVYALLTALITTCGVIGVIHLSAHWPEGTQVAWTGVESNAGPVVIGGAREESIVGWPNGSFSPSLKASPNGKGSATLEFSDSTAFIYDETANAFLNGVAINSGETKALDGYKIRLGGSWTRLWKPEVEVLGAGDERVATFDLPGTNPAKDRVYPLRTLVEQKGAGDEADAARLLKVGRWAADKRLLIARDGAVRLLGAESYRMQCRLPCRLSVLWANQKLPITVRSSDTKLSILFRPPWRLACPLPPVPAKGERGLLITGSARPDDVAFVLPVGHAVEDPRRVLTFAKDADGLPIFSGQGATPGAPPARDLPPGIEKPAPSDAPDVGTHVTSRIAVALGGTSLLFATVNDLPQPRGIAMLLVVALVCYAVGLFFMLWGVRDNTTQWVLCGLVACVWNFLAFRLLLALRFSLAPESLDGLTVKGLTTAFVGLAVVPGLLMLWARLRSDYSKLLEGKDVGNGFYSALIYLALLVSAFLIEYWYAPRLWVNLPQRFAPAMGWKFALLLLALLVYLVLTIVFLYRTVAEDERLAILHRLFLGPLRFDSTFARAGKRWWAAVDTAQPGGFVRLAAFALLAIFAFAAVPFALRAIPAREFLQEFFALFFLCMIPALFWLASKLYFRDEAEPASKRRLAILAVLLVVLPVFVVPVAMHDAGSVLATVSIFVPLLFLLLAARPRRTGVAVGLALLFVFLIAGFIYKNFLPIMPGEAEVRLLTFREGAGVERFMPWADVTNGGDGLSLQKLRDAYQHTWESKAIAYEGRWTGMGFGNAPTRMSQVRQDTIQYDSLFSFFVASEYGVAGSISLLLLYAVPLVLVLYGGWRSNFDFGYAAASIVASSFFLEAVLHAGMNLGTFPFTGRSMPLITPNSTTDMLRWLFLFGFAAQSLLWRNTLTESEREGDAASVILPQSDAGPQGREKLVRYALAAALVLAFPALLLCAVLWTDVRLVRDDTYQKPFEWKGVLARVGRLIDDRVIEVDQQTKTLRINKAVVDVPDGALIRQEILRFNALPIEERLDDSATRGYSERLRSVGSAAAYNQLLDDLRKDELNERRDTHASLFRLLPPVRWTDGTFVEERGGYRVTPNTDFNTQLSFRSGVDSKKAPRTSFQGEDAALIGPAWVNGRWVTTYDPAPSLPWTAQLARALDAEWSRLGHDEALSRYGKLTLDRKLHEAAMKFAAAKGRETYQSVMGGDAKSGKPATAALPPRVALSIINLPQGRVLALGGYPRMNSSPYWRKSTDTGEWMPPARWVEEEAPRALRLLYGGDRNFDRVVVGSATKPLWAGAVLATHPNLDRQLKVRGDGEQESDVFGIPVSTSRGWEVRKHDWYDFTQYLAYSDNRYHVRLGFLGLAAESNGQMLADGDSASDRESLNGGRTPWKKFPKFPPELLFSKSKHEQLAALHETPLADHLERMFAIDVGRRNFGARFSFWTQNETEDIFVEGQPQATSASRVFAAISPEAASFNLDRINSPRDFVSLLLGGGTNLWANVDLAAAFGTCLTGTPVVAHITGGDGDFKLLDDRERFPQIAARVRQGLSAVVRSGTATGGLQAVVKPQTTSAMALLNELERGGYSVYAKTGTLRAQQPGTRDMSRIVLAIVKWDGKKEEAVRSGLVFSLVGEQAETGAATKWLGEFLVANQSDIKRLLQK
ncbi:MAG: FtsW/RodA/SpoVE family cell cycle protein, partial [Acidobacteria bacterium]|nr:FtsW/RodA/SpoVE family cell cycle protein [Acidobacteriota bacterium]